MVLVGMIFKEKPVFQQFFLVYFDGKFPGGEQVLQQPPVPAEGIVNISDMIIGGAFQFIIKGRPAIIVAEFFIASAFYCFFTEQANPVFLLL